MVYRDEELQQLDGTLSAGSAAPAEAGGSPAASGRSAPHAGKLVVPEGAAHGYELVEQLTALPQPRARVADVHGLQRLDSSRAAEQWRQRSDWSHDDHALAHSWLASDGGGSMEGFCAADMHAAGAPLQLGPAATALVDVLAGLPMVIEQDRGRSDSQLAADGGRLPAQQRPGHGSVSSDAPLDAAAQELRDYSLQDSFARGHFGEGEPYA